MNGLAITIVHPSFENLKRSGGTLHLAAGLMIIGNALRQLQHPHIEQMYFWCQLFIGFDILLLVLANRNLSSDLPKVNTAFRCIESVMLTAAGTLLCTEKAWVMGIALTAIGLAYGYLLVCERRSHKEELVKFNHIGLTISGLPQSRFFLWSKINNVDVRYDHISIHTADRELQYPLRHNLQFEELDQIHEFCRHYLKT